MVAVMAFDRGVSVGVAWLALIVSCGPAVKPASPPAEPEPVRRQERTPLAASPGAKKIVVGEMCPQGAGGRPAVAPLVMRGVAWTDAAPEIAAVVERGSVPRFVVFGTDGKPAGTFDTLGLVDVGVNQSVASGTYVGASPCTYAVDAKPTPGATTSMRGEDPKCGPVTRGCGIAVGELARPDDAPETPVFQTGGACMSGNELAVDIDGDGKVESFPITGVLDSVRAPANEWTASPTATAACKPTYQIYDLKLAPEPRPGKPPEKGLVVVDVLGVIDLDGDGRKELVLGMRFPTVRTLAVYTATSSSQRLELAGEAPAFAK
jgi:hypothetical protein